VETKERGEGESVTGGGGKRIKRGQVTSDRGVEWSLCAGGGSIMRSEKMAKRVEDRTKRTKREWLYRVS